MKYAGYELTLELEGNWVTVIFSDPATATITCRIPTRVRPASQENQEALSAFNSGDKAAWKRNKGAREMQAALVDWLVDPHPRDTFTPKARDPLRQLAIGAIHHMGGSESSEQVARCWPPQDEQRYSRGNSLNKPYRQPGTGRGIYPKRLGAVWNKQKRSHHHDLDSRRRLCAHPGQHSSEQPGITD